MEINYGEEKSWGGPGVRISLTGDDVATAIRAWLVAQGVTVTGKHTVTINGDLCRGGHVTVAPEGSVETLDGQYFSGRGPENGRR